MIGPGGRQDLLYVGVVAVAAVGSALARLRPRGMARAMAATVAALVVVAVVALVAGLQDLDGASVAEILGITAMYVVALRDSPAGSSDRSVAAARPA